MTADLGEFLLARYAEIEQETREAQREADGWPLWVVTATDVAVGVDYNPTQVLADLAAKRGIVALHENAGEYVGQMEDACSTCGTFGEYGVPYPCETLRLLAQEFAGHSDFDPSWTLTP